MSNVEIWISSNSGAAQYLNMKKRITITISIIGTKHSIVTSTHAMKTPYPTIASNGQVSFN